MSGDPPQSVPWAVKGAKEYTIIWLQMISTPSNSTRKPFSQEPYVDSVVFSS